MNYHEVWELCSPLHDLLKSYDFTVGTVFPPEGKSAICHVSFVGPGGHRVEYTAKPSIEEVRDARNPGRIFQAVMRVEHSGPEGEVGSHSQLCAARKTSLTSVVGEAVAGAVASLEPRLKELFPKEKEES